MLSDPRLKWSDVENDDNFHNMLKYIVPIKDWVSTTTTKPDKHEQPQKKSVAQLCAELGFDDTDDEGISDIDFSVLSPPNKNKQNALAITVQQKANPLAMQLCNQPAPLSKLLQSGGTNSFQMAQHNSAVQYAVQSGELWGVVNINFVTNHYSKH